MEVVSVDLGQSRQIFHGFSCFTVEIADRPSTWQTFLSSPKNHIWEESCNQEKIGGTLGNLVSCDTFMHCHLSNTVSPRQCLQCREGLCPDCRTFLLESSCCCSRNIRPRETLSLRHSGMKAYSWKSVFMGLFVEDYCWFVLVRDSLQLVTPLRQRGKMQMGRILFSTFYKFKLLLGISIYCLLTLWTSSESCMERKMWFWKL